VTIASAHSARRARRLLRWYPPAWRARYGEEFCALLEDQWSEVPPTLRAQAGVAASGVVARAGRAGMTGCVIDAPSQWRASLAWVLAATAAFLTAGLAMWSQLLVAWQWTPPRADETKWATVGMSASLAALAVVVVVGAVPLVVAAARQLLGPGRRRLVVPVALCMASATALIVGAHRFENGWPGTGGHHWALQGIVPGGVAAFCWAATLSVSSYWAHPAALGAFPATEVAWMALSPIALVTGVASAAVTLRRVELSERHARFELRAAQAATVAMGAFLVAAVAWLSDGAVRRAALFHVGAIDVVGAIVMGATIALAHQAVHRGLAASRATRRGA